jgi:5-methyltetrahydrofolate--homocysteine methyltransferase
VGDDIEVYTDESRSTVFAVLHHMRQQAKKAPGQPNYALSDFIAPNCKVGNPIILVLSQ